MSREKKRKIVICIAGLTGCGKTTVARRLAEKYGLKYFSGGHTLRVLAVEAGYKPSRRGWWVTREGLQFHQQRMKNLEFDKRVDENLIEWAKRGNVVLDSWTMPWLLKNGFKIWLEASSEVRAKRLARRNRIDFRRALDILKEKDNKSKVIYKKCYGFTLGEDFSPFNLVLDTNSLDVEEVFNTLCIVIDRLYVKKKS